MRCVCMRCVCVCMRCVGCGGCGGALLGTMCVVRREREVCFCVCVCVCVCDYLLLSVCLMSVCAICVWRGRNISINNNDSMMTLIN
jgi:hypothetical protein